MNTADLKTAIEAESARVQAQFQLLIDRFGDRLFEAVNNGEVEHVVDRGLSRTLLANTSSSDLPRQLSTSGRIVKLLHFTEPPLMLGICVWSLFIFGWWGLASFPLALIFFIKGHQSNSFGGGTISILVAIAFFIFIYYADNSNEIWWGILGTSTALAQKLSYFIATSSVRLASLQSPDICRFAIDRNAVWLRAPRQD